MPLGPVQSGSRGTVRALERGSSLCEAVEWFAGGGTLRNDAVPQSSCHDEVFEI